MTEPSDDAAIAEFHAAARRRQVRIFAVAGAISILIGIAVIVIAILAGNAIEDRPYQQSTRYEIRTIIFGIAFVVGGAGFGWKALRTRRGENVD